MALHNLMRDSTTKDDDFDEYKRMEEQELNPSNIEDAPEVEVTRYEPTGDTYMTEVRNHIAENMKAKNAVINSYPKFHFSKETSAASSDGFGGGGDTSCTICLCEYKEAEMLRMMPECKHYFHLCCLDAWLKLNGPCPVYRNSPLPTPTSTTISTPLSEVVPLSLYAADRRRARRWDIFT
ncbi:RING-H2 finger protein ATL67-like [Brassica napus]|uniref:RING-H2 finger protein ATL67-like n=1 Tax=Brassica napus TaxID=3708 RepID=UPI00207AC770|nr:RING-H2 finger protein ATL67-like [Brassica napus]